MEFLDILKVIDPEDLVDRQFAIKLEFAIAHLLRIMEHCPTKQNPGPKDPGRLTMQCFIFMPSFGAPKTLILDPML